jgi:hypothetical protein
MVVPTNLELALSKCTILDLNSTEAITPMATITTRISSPIVSIPTALPTVRFLLDLKHELQKETRKLNE